MGHVQGRWWGAGFFLGWAMLGPLAGRSQVTPHPTTTNYLGEPVPQLVAKATAVFEGKAIGYHSFWNRAHTQIYTAHTVEVYKVFKGPVGAQVEIVTEGGTVGQTGMGIIDGFGLGERTAGLFCAVPFREATHRPTVPTDQVYEVVGHGSGFFEYSGIPPVFNAADTRFVRYTHIETSLYPLVEQAAGGPYRVLKPFDINRYNKIWERRGIDSQTLAPGAAPVSQGDKKRPLQPQANPASPAPRPRGVPRHGSKK
ncbi:hypothetical protein [Hymenobacter monticola]